MQPASRFRLPLFYAVTGLYWFSMYAFVPTLQNFAIDQGIAKKFVGVIAGSYGFVQMLLRVPLGVASDKLQKRKPFVTLGIVCLTLAVLGMYLFPNAPGLLAFRALTGAAAASWVSITVLYSSYFAASETTNAIGRISSVMYIGQILGMLACGAAAQALGPKTPFLVAAVAGCAGIGLSFFTVENAPQTKPLKLGALFRVGLHPKLLAVSFLAILYQTITFGTVQGFTPVFAKEIGASPMIQGLLVALFTFCVMLSALANSTFKIRDKTGAAPLIVGGFLVVSASVALMPLFPYTSALLGLVCLQGLAGGLFFSMLMGLGIEDIPADSRGAAMGFYQSIYGLGMFVGPVLVGALSSSFDLSVSFYALAGLGLASAAIAALLMRNHK